MVYSIKVVKVKVYQTLICLLSLALVWMIIQKEETTKISNRL